jgi:hypothetical protein
LPPAFPCGRLREPNRDAIDTVDYVVVYLNQRQRQVDTELVRWAEQVGQLVLEVSHRRAPPRVALRGAALRCRLTDQRAAGH